MLVLLLRRLGLLCPLFNTDNELGRVTIEDTGEMMKNA